MNAKDKSREMVVTVDADYQAIDRPYDVLSSLVYNARIAARNKYRATRIISHDSVAIGLIRKKLDEIERGE